MASTRRPSGLGWRPCTGSGYAARDLVNNGLPIHNGAKLLGHLDLQTTQGYVAVFEEDVIRHYQTFLINRRELRPADEYAEVTTQEWSEFQEHFDIQPASASSPPRSAGWTKDDYFNALPTWEQARRSRG
jgi:hypothetical protein